MFGWFKRKRANPERIEPTVGSTSSKQEELNAMDKESSTQQINFVSFDTDKVVYSEQRTHNEYKNWIDALKEIRVAFPDLVKPNQNPELKALLKQAVDNAKKAETIDFAIQANERAFELDNSLKELTLYHYKRQPTYYYKKKDFEQGTREIAKLFQGIPSQRPENTSDWFRYSSELHDLTATLLIMEKDSDKWMYALNHVISSIQDEVRSMRLGAEEAKRFKLFQIMQNDPTCREFEMCGTDTNPFSRRENGLYIDSEQWYDIYHQAKYYYLNIYWPLRTLKEFEVDRLNLDGKRYKTFRKVCKKLKLENETETLLNELVSSLSSDCWENELQHFSNTLQLKIKSLLDARS